jgi:hypothetical protein
MSPEETDKFDLDDQTLLFNRMPRMREILRHTSSMKHFCYEYSSKYLDVLTPEERDVLEKIINVCDNFNETFQSLFKSFE